MARRAAPIRAARCAVSSRPAVGAKRQLVWSAARGPIPRDWLAACMCSCCKLSTAPSNVVARGDRLGAGAWSESAVGGVPTSSPTRLAPSSSRARPRAPPPHPPPLPTRAIVAALRTPFRTGEVVARDRRARRLDSQRPPHFTPGCSRRRSVIMAGESVTEDERAEPARRRLVRLRGVTRIGMIRG